MEIIKSVAALLTLLMIGLRPSPEWEASTADLLARAVETVLALFV